MFKKIATTILILFICGVANAAEVWNLRIEEFGIEACLPKSFRLYNMMGTYSIHVPGDNMATVTVKKCDSIDNANNRNLVLKKHYDNINIGYFEGEAKLRGDEQNNLLIFVTKYDNEDFAIISYWKTDSDKKIVDKILSYIKQKGSYNNTIDFNKAVDIQKEEIKKQFAERKREYEQKQSKENFADDFSKIILDNPEKMDKIEDIEVNKGVATILRENSDLLRIAATRHKQLESDVYWWSNAVGSWKQYIYRKGYSSSSSRDCFACGGTGKNAGEDCLKCGGTGKIEIEGKTVKKKNESIKKLVYSLDKYRDECYELKNDIKEEFINVLNGGDTDKLGKLIDKKTVTPSKMKMVRLDYPGDGCYMCGNEDNHKDGCPLSEKGKK